jgi:heterodisulfide reductase subunit C
MPGESIQSAAPARLEFDLWRQQAEHLADLSTDFCYRCGACISTCLAARYGTDFDPREIMLQARYGMWSSLLSTHSVLWQCFKCDNCVGRCPQGNKPVDVITALKQILAQRLESAPIL